MPAKPHITHQFAQRESGNSNARFEDQYLALRKKEKRLYSDEQVRQLPSVPSDHPHYKEWLVRKHSSEKLLKYLRKMKRPLNILEVGCGNGWLAHKLAGIPGATVTGFDINIPELQQAARIFSHRANLQFDSGDPFLFKSDDKLFDVIIFAASLQYFPSLDAIIDGALKHLRSGGSIHIIDSHFYKAEEVAAAKQRTTDHFTALGFPALSRHYFHHTLVMLSKFNFTVLYNPHSLFNRWQRNRNPFHWISIKKP